MPSRRNSIANTQHPTHLRRSSRLQQLQQQERQQPEEEHSTNPKSKSRTSFRKPPLGPSLSSTPNVFAKKIQRGDPERDTKKLKKTSIGSRNCENSTSGLRRSPRLSKCVDEFSCLSRSPKYFYKENTENVVQKARSDTSVRVADRGIKLGVGKAKVGVDSCQQVVKKPGKKVGFEGVSCVRRSPRFSHKEDTQRVVEKVKIDKPVRVTEKEAKAGVGNAKNCAKKKEMTLRSSRIESVTVEVEAEGGKVRDADKGNKEGVKRKRKRGEEGDRILNGWTKGEEAALQRAYFAVKPTPHFWKKVAKLVPGKSAQDCFNKIHSDHSTPPQPQPRSRAKKTMSSPLGSFSLSASKLLKPTEQKIKRPRHSKQKSHLAQKAVRHLLRKHYDVDQDHGADLFSVLEPNTEPSTQKVSQSTLFSTPKHKIKKSGLLQHCERSSSGRKKPLSRFSRLCPTALISPPVLKQVKNRALHEKYIDQLHNREAKRKAASSRATKSKPRIESRKENHFQKLDVVKAALISGARDAINQFQHLQANASVNSSELDDDGDGTDTDDEGIFSIMKSRMLKSSHNVEGTLLYWEP